MRPRLLALSLLAVSPLVLPWALPAAAGGPGAPSPRVALDQARTGAWTVRLRSVRDEAGRTWLEVREDRVVAARADEVVLEQRAWSFRPQGVARTTGRQVLAREGLTLEGLLEPALDCLGAPRLRGLRSSDERVERAGRAFACRRHQARLRLAWCEGWDGPERSLQAVATVWLDPSLPVPVPVAMRGQLIERLPGDGAPRPTRLDVEETLRGLGDAEGARWGADLAGLLAELGAAER